MLSKECFIIQDFALLSRDEDDVAKMATLGERPSAGRYMVGMPTNGSVANGSVSDDSSIADGPMDLTIILPDNMATYLTVDSG